VGSETPLERIEKGGASGATNCRGGVGGSCAERVPDLAQVVAEPVVVVAC
jgi:hypothetical protein